MFAVCLFGCLSDDVLCCDVVLVVLVVLVLVLVLVVIMIVFLVIVVVVVVATVEDILLRFALARMRLWP